MNSILPKFTFALPVAAMILLMMVFSARAQAQQQPPNPGAGASAPRPAQKLSPKQQITGFYATCKNGEGGRGLRDMLSANPVVKAEDVQKVAAAFEQMLSTMGGFVDFDFLRETDLTERITVIRCAAHFERQPFMNEFTFYDPGNGDWRLVHLRYDANLASMFTDDLRGGGED